MRSMTRMLVLGCAVALLAGCVTMKAVQDYSTASHATLANVQPVAKDYSDSCTRKQQYLPFQGDLNACAEFEKGSKAIQAAAKVLDNYVVALGALATDDLANYNTELDGLAKAVKDAKIMKEEQADAVGHVVALIAKAATSHYQQKEIAKALAEGDDAVASASQGLADVIGTAYGTVLTNELAYWKRSLQDMQPSNAGKQTIEWKDYVAKQWLVRAEIEAKRSAASALAKSISNIGVMHTKLKKDAEKLTEKDVYAAVRAYYDDAVPVLKEVQQAFKTN